MTSSVMDVRWSPYSNRVRVGVDVYSLSAFTISMYKL
jgi:hypothetical protein